MKIHNYTKALRYLRLCLALVLLFYSGISRAQVNYTEGFEVNGSNAGFTTSGGGFYQWTNSLPCSGTGAVRNNLYFGGTWDFTSGLLGTSVGGLVTLNFDYKVTNWSAGTTATTVNWGTCNVQYSNSAFGPWTSAGTVLGSTHVPSTTCTTRTFTFTPSAGPLYIRFSTTYGGLGDYWFYFDNINLFEATGACSGTPTPGNTVSTAASVCPGTIFGLSLSTPPATTGNTYQWYSSADGLTYGVIPGATSATYSASQTAPTYYYCEVTCSGNSATSTPVLVGINTYLDCYCTSGATSSFDEEIKGVVFGPINNPSSCGVAAGGPGSVASQYSNFTNLPLQNFEQGNVYPLSVTLGTCNGTYSSALKAFADWNHDGDFTDAGEEIFAYDAGTNFFGWVDPTIASGGILIPSGAALGTTRVRFVFVETSLGNVFPCGGYTWGETEDYNINVIPPPPCTDPPTAGNAVANDSSVCAGSVINLSLTGNSTGLGQTYQWQESPDNMVYTDIPGATSPFLNGLTINQAVYYRCNVTCGTSTVPSSVVNVVLNPAYFCYCPSSPFSFYNFDEEIFNVSIGSVLNNTSNCASSNQVYTNYYNLGPSTVQSDSVYTFSVTLGTCGFNNFFSGVKFFADWNQDGDFTDGGEEIFDTTLSSGYTSGQVISSSVLIPVNAVYGTTGLRVIFAGTNANNIFPCGNFFATGETEDYLLNVIPPPPCVDPPTPGTVAASDSAVCIGSGSNLSLLGNSKGFGQTYQWQESPDSVTWVDIFGATAMTTTVLPTSNTYYRCVLTCSGGTPVETPGLLISTIATPNAGTLTGPAIGNALTVYPFAVLGSDPGLNYTWEFSTVSGGPYTSIPGITTDTTSLSAAGQAIFYLRVTVTDPLTGCSASTNELLFEVVIGNDNVCDAYPIVIGTNGPYTNAGATAQANEPAPPAGGCTTQGQWCEGNVNNSVWFTFQVPMGGSGRYFFRVPAWDSQVAIYEASSCSAVLGTSILRGANDDAGTAYPPVNGEGGFTSFNSNARAYCLTPGATYYIQVDGYFGTQMSPFYLLVLDDGPYDAEFTGLPAVVCQSDAAYALGDVSPAGTFSGTGVSGSSFSPSTAGPGTYTVTYTGNNENSCYSYSQQVIVDPAFNYYADFDNDGFGDPAAGIFVCLVSPPMGYVGNNTDCNDGDNTVYPGAPELCDFKDNNCNGITDEGYDQDNDGYKVCENDCNDNDPNVNPGADEFCNNTDDDCNGLVDDNTPAITTHAISGNGVQCVQVVNGSANFSVPASDYATEYNWTVPAGMFINSGQGTNSIVVSWTTLSVQSGIIGSVCVTASNNCETGNTSCTPVDIQYTNPVTPPSISGPSRICPGATANYVINNVARASYYSWIPPVGMTITSGQGTNAISVSVDNLYNGGALTVYAGNVCGLSNSPRIKNLLLDYPNVPAIISGPASGVCGQSGVVYSTTGAANALSYFWQVPAGATIVGSNTGSSITVDFDANFAGGTIVVSGINNCGAGSARSLQVTGAPGQPGVISGPVNVCPNSVQAYSVATVAGAISYTWSAPGIATVTSGQGTKNVELTYSSTQAVGQVITVRTTNNCGTSAVRLLSGISSQFGNCIRLGSADQSSFSSYPNPASNSTRVQFSTEREMRFRLNLIDASGKSVQVEEGMSAAGINYLDLDVSEMAPGLYLITLESEGEIRQSRLVIE